jgi:hypothetical protein
MRKHHARNPKKRSEMGRKIDRRDTDTSGMLTIEPCAQTITLQGGQEVMGMPEIIAAVCLKRVGYRNKSVTRCNK